MSSLSLEPDFLDPDRARGRLGRVWVGWAMLHVGVVVAAAVALDELTQIEPWTWAGPAAPALPRARA